MTITEMHTNLKLEIDKTDSLDSVGFESEELDYWLNSAIRSLVKTKYSGSGSGEAFEQNQKRIDDLRTLVYEDDISITRATDNEDKPNSYKASLSSATETYWFTLSEEVDIVYQSSTTATISGSLVVGSIYKVSGDTVTHNGVTYNIGDYFEAANANYTGSGSIYLCTSVRQGIIETTSDTYRQEIDNPYSEHVFENNKAKPLRLYRDTDIELITDGNYGIFKYYLRYLKKPDEVDLDTVTNSDLPEHTHDEIVKLAANMILENIENPRYRTHTIEVNRTE
jgi:hypothetical protein